MRIATWNINNRVGRTKFRPEAADAILALEADVVVITEYFPRRHHEVFCETLRAGGFKHQHLSKGPSEGSNKVLIAALREFEPAAVSMPAFDIQFPSNIAAVRFAPEKFTLLGVRVPWYPSSEATLTMQAWDWLEQVAKQLQGQAAVITGDLNVRLDSTLARGARHLSRMLQGGWRRAEPEGYSFRGGAEGDQIDHLLYSQCCTLKSSSLLLRKGKFELCEGEGALSDHAALIAEVSLRDEQSDSESCDLVDEEANGRIT